MSNDLVTKYLEKYAEDEVELLTTFPEMFYQHVLILPAYQESEQFVDTYLNGQFSSLLTILVINQPERDSNSKPQVNLYQHIINNSQSLWSQDHLSLHQCSDPSSAILCIRRYEKPLRLSNSQGVGQARKIAADCALQLIQMLHIASHWILSTDADSHLPDDTFDRLAQLSICAAVTFNFKHETNKGPVSQATLIYEKSLHYYRAGLEWAGSPYAFYSLGSSLAVNAIDYARVRGFPKRAGGEDFYLLNKLRKIGLIKHCSDIEVQIESRTSDRVPFGTGPAISRILSLDSPHHYRYYNPKVFEALKHCLQVLKSLTPVSAYTNWEDVLEEQHFAWLDAQGLKRIYMHMQQQKLEKTALQQSLMDWFDGLMTLRFINHIRDTEHPDCLLIDAIEQAPFNTT